MHQKIAKLAFLAAGRRRLLLEAAVRLVWWRLLLAIFPFRRIAAHLERVAGEPHSEPTAGDSRVVENIRWAIAAAARHGPWRMTCLPQALAAAAMLRARAIPATLFIGANPSPAGFSGHAWVVAQGVYVCGGRGSANLAVLARYAC